MPGELLTFQLTLKLQASENLNPILERNIRVRRYATRSIRVLHDNIARSNMIRKKVWGIICS